MAEFVYLRARSLASVGTCSFVISLLQHFHLTFSVRVFYYDTLGHFSQYACKSKGKLFPYSLPSVGPGADPGVQAVSPQVT